MARAKLEVQILGDEGDLLRAFKKSESGARSFNRSLTQAGKGAVVASVGFKGLGRSVAYASSAFLGGAGLAFAIKSTLGAAMEAQKQEAQLTHALLTQTNTLKSQIPVIDERIQKMGELAGIDDELVSNIFANFVRRTNDVNQALKLTNLAIDVARGRSIKLEAAQSLVIRASLGMAGALRRVGIAADKNANSAQLLDILQRKYAGSAKVYGDTAAGAMDKFQVALENTQEVIGEALLPSITKVLDRTTDWLNKEKNRQKIQEFANDTAETGTQIVKGLAKAWDGLVSVWEVGEKTDPFQGKSLPEVLKAVQGVDALEDEFHQLNSVIAFTASNNGPLNALKAKWDDLFASMRRVADVMNEVEGIRIDPKRFVPPPLPLPSGTAQFSRALTEREQLDITLAGDPDNVAALKRKREMFQTALSFALKQIRSHRGDTADFAQHAERLTGEIAAINVRLKGIAEENAAKAADAREKWIEALIPNEVSGRAMTDALAKFRRNLIPDIVRGQGRASQAVLEAGQFMRLGLSATGEELAPTEAALREQLKKVQDGLKGTLLDTNENRNLLAGIGDVLARNLGKATDAVRFKMRELLDALAGKDNPELTPWAAPSTKQLTEGLGLSRAQRAMFRQRLAGAGLTPAPMGPRPLIPAHVGGSGIVVNGDIHNHGVQNVDDLIRQIKRKASHGAAQTRGRHGGHILGLN